PGGGPPGGADAARTAAQDGPQAPAARATGCSRATRLRRPQVRLAALVRRRHCPARPLADLPAPDASGADYNHRRGAEALAQPLRAPARPRGPALNVDQKLTAIRDVIQEDAGNRGLARDPHDNLLTATRDDFANACASITQHPHPVVESFTGFYIPSAQPPAFETDGPLGTLFFAQVLFQARISLRVIAPLLCMIAIREGATAARMPFRNQRNML